MSSRSDNNMFRMIYILRNINSLLKRYERTKNIYNHRVIENKSVIYLVKKNRLLVPVSLRNNTQAMGTKCDRANIDTNGWIVRSVVGGERRIVKLNQNLCVYTCFSEV